MIQQFLQLAVIVEVIWSSFRVLPLTTTTATRLSLQVFGDFQVQDSVQLCDDTGMEFARALTNFSSEDLNKIIKGKLWRSDMAQSLGYGTMEEVAHR